MDRAVRPVDLRSAALTGDVARRSLGGLLALARWQQPITGRGFLVGASTAVGLSWAWLCLPRRARCRTVDEALPRPARRRTVLRSSRSPSRGSPALTVTIGGVVIARGAKLKAIDWNWGDVTRVRGCR